jgi:hypothetical protein
MIANMIIIALAGVLIFKENSSLTNKIGITFEIINQLNNNLNRTNICNL